MRRTRLIEGLINREIRRLIIEAAYATDLGKTVGTEGLKLLNQKNSLLNKMLRFIPGGSNSVRNACTKLQNGEIDLSVLDSIGNGVISTIASSYATILTPMLDNENVKGFANADTATIKRAIQSKFGNVPAPVIDCILQISASLKNGGTAVGRGINTVVRGAKDAGRAVGDFYNRNKPW